MSYRGLPPHKFTPKMGVPDIAVAERTYRGTAITEFDTMAQEVADARRDGSVDQAGVHVTATTARGTATETYGHAIADATRDWQQLDAWTKRHAIWGTLDTTTAPNNTVWGTATGTAATNYFNAMAQAARDEVTWWGVKYLVQVDREALAVKTQQTNTAEAVRVRDNDIAGYESAYDVLWNNTLNTAVQAAMFVGRVPITPWHGYVGATTQAQHDFVATTRPAELILDVARNDAEKEYQVAVAEARETLAHNRGQQDIDKAMADTNTDIAAAQAKFNARTPLDEPTPPEYSEGFGETFPARPRRVVEYFDPTMPNMPITPPAVLEPVGYGLYEDGAPKPWADLLHPPAQIGMGGFPLAPQPSPLTPLPWFAQGYEPDWLPSLTANSVMSGMGMYSTTEEAHDEYGDSMDGAEILPGDFMSFSADTNFAWNSPASVFGRAQSQTEWEQFLSSQPYSTSWWKASMSSVYAGATGPKINGNDLVSLLTSDLEGAAGVDLPGPGASTFLTNTSTTPADPGRVGGPQVTPPGNAPDRPQGKSNEQNAIPSFPYSPTTVATVLPTSQSPKLADRTPPREFQVAMNDAHAPTRTEVSGPAIAPTAAQGASLPATTKSVETPPAAPVADAQERVRIRIVEVVKEMNELRRTWISDTGRSEVEFEEQVRWHEYWGPAVSGGSGIKNRPARFAVLRLELKELSAQWQTLIGGTTPAPNPIKRASETFEQRFSGRLAVAKQSIAKIELLQSQLAQRGEQSDGKKFDASDLAQEIDAAVKLYNEATKEAYAIYNAGTVDWRNIERLCNAPTLGRVGLQNLSEIGRNELNPAGDRISRTANGLQAWETTLKWTDRAGTGLMLVTGAGAVFQATAKKLGQEASKRVIIEITAVKVAGGVAAGVIIGSGAEKALDYAGVPPTARRLAALGIDVVQLVLLHRRAKSLPVESAPDAIPSTPNTKPVEPHHIREGTSPDVKKNLADPDNLASQSSGQHKEKHKGNATQGITNAPDIEPLPSNLPWRSWYALPKVVENGKIYAKIGDRLYTQHAVDRMLPSGLGRPAGGAGAGRSISPNFVEDVIRRGRQRQVTVDGVPRTIHTLGTVEVVTEQSGRIVITINPFSGE